MENHENSIRFKNLKRKECFTNKKRTLIQVIFFARFPFAYIQCVILRN